uniref:Uncharacterized protein n=1 Tax=Caenorhabditis japonica TaxID=281687 RepID=A0A8R1HQT5_CAEJA
MLPTYNIVQTLLFSVILLVETAPRPQTQNDPSPLSPQQETVTDKKVTSSSSPSSSSSAASDAKFMADMIEVQRTYRSLKEKWQRMMEEKEKVLRIASTSSPPPVTSTPAPTSTTTTTLPANKNQIQQIDVDVFDELEKFQDISAADEESPFDDEAFIDISTPNKTVGRENENENENGHRNGNGLAEIQQIIKEAFSFQSSAPRVAGSVTSGKDQVASTVVTTVAEESEDPFEGSSTTGTTVAPITTGSPTTNATFSTGTVTTSTFLPTTTLPIHILPTSHFHSSGSNPAALPAHALFRHPEPVKIAFFGSAPVQDEGPLAPPLRPTTPEPENGEEEEEVDYEAVETPGTSSIVPTTNTTFLGIENSDDYEEEVFSNEEMRNENGTEIGKSADLEGQTIMDKAVPDQNFETGNLPGNELGPNFGPEAPEASSIDQEAAQMGSGPEFDHSTPEIEPATSAQINLAPEFDPSVRQPETEPPKEARIDLGPEFGFGPNPSAPEPPTAARMGPGPEFGFGPSLSTPEDLPIDQNLGRSPSGPESEPSTAARIGPKPPTAARIGPGPEIEFGPSFSGSVRPPIDQEFALSPSAPRPKSPTAARIGPVPPTAAQIVLGPEFGFGPSLSTPEASPIDQNLGHSPSDPEFGPSAPEPAPPTSARIGPGPELVFDPSPARPDLGPGIGRSPPGSSQYTTFSHSPTPFPTLLAQNFFDDDDDDQGDTSSFGSFASAEQAFSGSISIPTKPPAKQEKPLGIFPTRPKIAALNQRAYRPPMFPSAMSSLTVTMPVARNSYLERTTIGPVLTNSVDVIMPAWGAPNDNGIMNKARREYHKDFQQQIRDVRMIDEEITRISQMNDDGRAKTGQRCSQVFAHTLSLSQIQQMSQSLGLYDVTHVLKNASDLTRPRRKNLEIAQLELELEEKRKLIAKIEILLSLAESRAKLFDLLQEQKKIVERMEDEALDGLQKTNFRPSPPDVFSAASDISELSSAVRQVLSSKQPKLAVVSKGLSMMKRKKTIVKKKTPEQEKYIEKVLQGIENQLNNGPKKSGHLQETAEIVEPVLSSVPTLLQNNQFGRQPMAMAVHRRPLPVAPPTMSPAAFKFGPRPSQRAAHRLESQPPLKIPPTEDEVIESDTVHELIDMLHEDIIKLYVAEKKKNLCSSHQIYEFTVGRVRAMSATPSDRGDLCNFESSHDETTRLMRGRRRDRRSVPASDDLLAEPSKIADDLLPFTFRAWSIWAGRRAEMQKQIDIGPDFSPQNTHFAAVFLEPQQAGILSVPLVLSPVSTSIRLKLFEGTRGIRLRVCCDRYCALETELGLYRGHRSWLRKTVTCPPNTQTLSFECLNDGSERGACGIDDVFVNSSRCQNFFSEPDQP